MGITFTCEHCRKPMRVPDATAGRKGRCRHCDGVVRVPGQKLSPSDSGEVAPLDLTASGERELVNTLAAPTDQGHPDLEHERLALERAKLEFDRRRLERDREALERSPEDEGPEEVECPACCETIKARAKLCKHCGTELRRGRSGRVEAKGKKEVNLSARRFSGTRGNPALAAVFSFLLTGMGQVYLGELVRGVMMLGFALCCGIVGIFVPLIWLLALCVWIYSMVDAAMLAQQPRLTRTASGRSTRYRAGSNSVATCVVVAGVIAAVGLLVAAVLLRLR